MQQLGDASRSVGCTILELRAAVVAECGSVHEVGSDDLVDSGIGMFPASQGDVVDVETWTPLLTCGPLDLTEKSRLCMYNEHL